MTVSSRRSLLAGFASVGVLGLAACSGVREIPPEAQSLGAVGDGPLKIRTRDKLEVDLSSLLSAFEDTGNLITVSVTGTRGLVTAKIWLMRDLTGGDMPYGFVKRELLDYFIVEVLGGVSGKSPGSIVFSGYTAPNGSGSRVTQTLSLMCDDTPPTTWPMGANTLGGFGGFPVHRYMPGNPQDWVLPNMGQFALLKDPKPRTELGSGRSYPNGYCRLVLASALYGGPPLLPPVAGKSAMVVLYNKSLGQMRMLTVKFVGGQTDVAPWPAIDTLGKQDAPTTQLGVAMRVPSNFAYGSTFMLEEGDHLNSTLQVGFTTGFGVTTIAGVAPGGCFTGESKVYTANPVFNERLVTWRGRTPGTYADRLNFDLRSIKRTVTHTIGFRFTRLKLGQLQLYDGNGDYGDWNITCMDHVEAERLGRAATTCATIDLTSGMNTCIISNFIKGQLKFSGNDFQVVGNRIETPANVALTPGDSANFTGSSFNSDDSTAGAVVAFNLWINKQGPDSLVHVDYLQGNNTSTPAGDKRGMRFYGNAIHAGKRRISTGTAAGRAGDLGKNLPGGAECVFMFDFGPTNWQWEVAGNLIVESVYWGLGFKNPAAGTKIRHNMLLDDLANTNPVYDHDKPTIELQASGGWSTANNNGIYIENNIQSQSYIAQSGGIDATAYDNTLLGVSPAWQIANLVNPTIGGAAKDIADVEAAFSFKPGAPIRQGPFHDKTLLDMRRHTADLPRIFA